jgi:glycerophosphoryl diester phosphodiesterase
MTANPWLRPNRPLAISHRGYSTHYPENTRLAYEKAVELGCEMIECDVNISKDGVLVMMHDAKLDRTTTGSGKVSDYTFEELQRLDAGVKFKPEFQGTPIPTTLDTLRYYREVGIYGCFEVKGGDEPTSLRIAEALVDLFVKEDALGYAFMSSYWHPAMALAKAKVPELMLAPERLPDDGAPNSPEAIRQAQALTSQVLQYQYTVLTQDVMNDLHAANLAVWSWTTNSEQSMLDSLAFGADALMGDDIKLMVEILDRERPKAKA